jgi:hypothetical protein
VNISGTVTLKGAGSSIQSVRVLDENGYDRGAGSGQVVGSDYRVTLPTNSLYTIVTRQAASAVAAPTFSPPAGNYASAQNVTIATSTAGASIRYTTDGSAPTSSAGTLYSSAVSISSTTALKAIAYKSGMADSAITSGTYTIGGQPPTGVLQVADLQLQSTGRRIGAIEVRFSEAISFTPDAYNYMILQRGGNGLGVPRRVKLATPTYDAATFTVRLVPRVPLAANKVYQLVLNAAGGIRSLSGQQLDGDGDLAEGGDYSRFVSQGSRLQYVDPDGDLVRVQINNGGLLQMVRGSDGNADRLTVLMHGSKSILKGLIKPRAGSSSSAPIDLLELNGTPSQLPEGFAPGQMQP